jgi:hypothetical protein
MTLKTQWPMDLPGEGGWAEAAAPPPTVILLLCPMAVLHLQAENVSGNTASLIPQPVWLPDQAPSATPACASS